MSNLKDYTDLEGKTLKQALKEFEAEVIRVAMVRYHDNKSEVARQLQMSRTSLMTKLREYFAV